MTKGGAREWERRYVGRHPFLFYNLCRLGSSHRNLLVDRSPQIIIEGFLHSGNTFAVVAFEQAQRESVRVAHHLHMQAQVIRATQWSIRIFLQARKPTDAALSRVIGVPIPQALKHRGSFYEKAAEYGDALVLEFFEDVTRDYGTVLERINAKFGTGFSSFVHSEDNVKCVLDRIEEEHCAMRGGRLDEKVRAHLSAVKVGLKVALKKELEVPEVRKLTARSRLRQLRAYGEPRTLGSRPYVVFYAAIDRSVYLVYGGVGQRPAGGHREMMRPLQSSIS
jgi:hypothetical protein